MDGRRSGDGAMNVSAITEEVFHATRRYLRGEISLDALEDVAAEHIHVPASLPLLAPVVSLLGAIELSLAELSNGDITEAELRQDLQEELAVLEQSVYAEPAAASPQPRPSS